MELWSQHKSSFKPMQDTLALAPMNPRVIQQAIIGGSGQPKTNETTVPEVRMSHPNSNL
jgi:hypothetical protein